jgi:hypothetical protein
MTSNEPDRHVDAKAMLREILKYKQTHTGDAIFTKYDSRIAAASVLSAIIAIAIAAFWRILPEHKHYAMLTSNSLLFLSLIFIGFLNIRYCLANIIKVLNYSTFVEFTADPVLDQYDYSIGMAKKISAVDINELRLLIDLFELSIKQTKARLSLFIGSIEIAGIIPLGLSAFVAYHRFFSESTFIESPYINFFIAIITIFYASGVLIIIKTHRLEHIVLLLKRAEDIKKSVASQSVLNATSP